MTDIEKECYCEDPRHPGRKLWLCGSDLCKRFLNKNYREGKMNGVSTVINDDGPDEE